MTNERTTLYTVKEIEATVDMSEVHIRRLLSAGELVGQKVGRDWIISVDETQRFIQQRRSRWEKY